MPRISTAYVKNIVRRGFNELIDPDPTADQKALIWRHFAGECAYCGIALDRAGREGRIDHAVWPFVPRRVIPPGKVNPPQIGRTSRLSIFSGASPLSCSQDFWIQAKPLHIGGESRARPHRIEERIA